MNKKTEAILEKYGFQKIASKDLLKWTAPDDGIVYAEEGTLFYFFPETAWCRHGSGTIILSLHLFGVVKGAQVKLGLPIPSILRNPKQWEETLAAR